MQIPRWELSARALEVHASEIEDTFTILSRIGRKVGVRTAQRKVLTARTNGVIDE